MLYREKTMRLSRKRARSLPRFLNFFFSQNSKDWFLSLLLDLPPIPHIFFTPHHWQWGLDVLEEHTNMRRQNRSKTFPLQRGYPCLKEVSRRTGTSLLTVKRGADHDSMWGVLALIWDSRQQRVAATKDGECCENCAQKRRANKTATGTFTSTPFCHGARAVISSGATWTPLCSSEGWHWWWCKNNRKLHLMPIPTYVWESTVLFHRDCEASSAVWWGNG